MKPIFRTKKSAVRAFSTESIKKFGLKSISIIGLSTQFLFGRFFFLFVKFKLMKNRETETFWTDYLEYRRGDLTDCVDRWSLSFSWSRISHTIVKGLAQSHYFFLSVPYWTQIVDVSSNVYYWIRGKFKADYLAMALWYQRKRKPNHINTRHCLSVYLLTIHVEHDH